MISQVEARGQAVDFLDSENLPELSKMTKEGACLSEIFPKAMKSLGKKRILALYRKLPSELREYLLIYFLTDSEKFNERLRKIDDKYGGLNLAPNSKYFQAVEKALVKYLKE